MSMTISGVRSILWQACDEAGGVRAWAQKHEFSIDYAFDVLVGTRSPGPAILACIGLEEVQQADHTVYKLREIPKKPAAPSIRRQQERRRA